MKIIKIKFNEFIGEIKSAINELKNKNTIKKQIPNLVSISRMAFIPFIITNILSGNILCAGILTAAATATDKIDGFLARKLNAISELGKKLDASIDKLFAFSVGIPFAIISPILFIPLTLELGILSINSYAYLKSFKPETNKIGKIKTVALDMFLISLFFSNIRVIKILSDFDLVLTILLQFYTISEYSNSLYKNIRKKDLNKLTIISSKENNESKDNDLSFTLTKKKNLTNLEKLKEFKQQYLQENNLEDTQKIKQKKQKNNIN